ncbi:MAG TPA: oxidoreductase C-terminal domain-containing protein, partial [Chthonomonadales bacterium]|nr:oxidoreductase C-terminal domain-containing protein [Chthonomonadales bacterium]
QRSAAAVAINRGKDVQRVMPLIKARIEVDPDKLRDENIDLRSLMPGAKPVRTHQHRVAPHPVARPGEEAR